MTAALSQPQPHPLAEGKPLRLISVEEYLQSEEASLVKREYVGGTVYAMAGARNVHQTLATNFVSLAHAKLRGKPCQSFDSNTKVRIRLPDQTRFYYPDGMVVCDPNPANEVFQDRPTIIAEVLSPATRRVDEREKRDAYLTIPTLNTYLIIDTDAPRVTVYQRTDGKFVEQLYEGLAATIPLSVIRTDLALAELYERVDFAEVAKDAQRETDEQIG